MLYCGIDIAKRTHETCVLNDEGRVVFHQRFHNGRSEAERFVAQLQQKCDCLTNDLEFVMEATGHYWMPLYCFLVGKGFSVKVINPIQSDAARNLYIRKTKTDAKDSFILADMLRMNCALPSRTPDEFTLRLQTLERTRFGFIDQVASLKLRIIGVLDRVFPEYETLFSDVFIKTSRQLLREYTTPDEMAAADLAELAALLSRASRGRFGADKARQIKECARATFGLPIAVDAFQLELKLLLDQVEFIEAQIERLEESVALILDEMVEAGVLPARTDNNKHVLQTIPGIGPITLAALLGEVGDISRFRTHKQLAAYAGIDASVNESGESRGASAVSKRGSPYLRRALWQSAQSARRFNPRFAEYYERKLAEGKHPSVAIGAVARKLVTVIFHVWSQNRDYDPDYVWQPTKPGVDSF